VWDVPLIGVNHVYAHAYAAALDAEAIAYPAVALICSGGHSALYRCAAPTELELLGSTLDDAAGEAFDKVAAILHLGYPGGPAIATAAAAGDTRRFRFTRPMTNRPGLDFSFSGLKTATKRCVDELETTEAELPVADLAASVQEAIVDVLVAKTTRAATAERLDTIAVSGGVGANSRLRERFDQVARRSGLRVLFPSLELCTDNAAMVGGLGLRLLERGEALTGRALLEQDIYTTARRSR